MKKKTNKKANSSRASDTLKKERRKKKKKTGTDPVLIAKPYERKWGNQFSLKYTNEEIERLADKMIDYFKRNTHAVYFTNFSTSAMITRQRLYEFVKQNEYFSYCYEIVKGIIISRFIKFGLGGKNAGFPIFGLKNIDKENFKDRQDVDVKNYEIDLNRFTERGLERLKNGEDPQSVMLDPASVRLD